jgi:transcriptional regulator with XRE-family HTH domain
VNIDIEKLCELHARGWSQKDIAHALAVEPSTVSRWVRDLGLDGQAGKQAKRDAGIRELHAKGLDQKSIAQELGLDRSTVSRRLGVMGLRLARARLEKIAALDYERVVAAPVEWSPPPPAPGFVYFVGSENLVKIGYSCTDLRSRFNNMRVANPNLRVLAVVEVDDAPTAEKRLHERFAAFRECGEWFRLDVPLAALVGDLQRLAAEAALLLA